MPGTASVRGLLRPVVLAAAVLLLAGACAAPSGTPRSGETGGRGLDDPIKMDTAMRLVSSAENSSLNWKAQYGYLEDIGDGRGYTGGIVGFTSGTGDMLDLVRNFSRRLPGNALEPFLPALEQVNGSDSHAGLGDGFVAAWKSVADDPAFRSAQDDERDRMYFDPAVKKGKADGLRALGQFIYYDALVVHGPGGEWPSFGAIRSRAMKRAPTPAHGGDETAYLNTFLDVRNEAMRMEAAHADTSRVDTAQRRFLKDGNLDLNRPLRWHVYGDAYVLR